MRKRQMRRFAGMFLLIAGIMLMPVFGAEASEKKTTEAVPAEVGTEVKEFVEGTLQQTVKTAEIKEGPDEDSDTLASLEKGTAVIVYGEPEDSWSRIEYRGIEGYIESDTLEQYQAADVDNLGQEFQSVEEENLRTVDEYELLQKERRTSRIWGSVIGIIVIVIFVVGIISALKQNREKEEDK